MITRRSAYHYSLFVAVFSILCTPRILVISTKEKDKNIIDKVGRNNNKDERRLGGRGWPTSHENPSDPKLKHGKENFEKSIGKLIGSRRKKKKTMTEDGKKEDTEEELYFYRWDKNASGAVVDYLFETEVKVIKPAIPTVSEKKEALKNTSNTHGNITLSDEGKIVDSKKLSPVKNQAMEKGSIEVKDEEKGISNLEAGTNGNEKTNEKRKTDEEPSDESSSSSEEEEEFNEEAFIKNMEGKWKFIDLPREGATVVEFYAHWCPHCQDFKPEYIEIAKELNRRAINTKVNFLAVSCEVYKNACLTYKVDGYPTLRGFLEGQKSNLIYEGWDGIDLNHDEQTADSIAKALGIEISSEERDGVVPLEEFSSSSDREKYVKEMAEDAEKARLEKIREHEYPRPVRDVYRDAGRSLIFMLQSQIFKTPGRLTGARKKTFAEWIDLLSWTLPVEWGLRHQLISQLKDEIEFVTRGKEILDDVLEHHRPSSFGIHYLPEKNARRSVTGSDDATFSTKKWSEQCSHGNPGRGFACGLWELFHIVSIGASERMPRGPVDGNAVHQRHVAKTIRNVVGHFFACDVCRRHFLNFFDNCGLNHCTRLASDRAPSGGREMALWLWETHNSVNARLMKERAERDWRNVTEGEAEAAMWPTKKMCGDCRRDDGSWNGDAVYQFLKRQYWPDSDDRNVFFSSTGNEFDDREESGKVRYVCMVVFFILSMILAQRWILKRSLARSGRHKKCEDGGNALCSNDNGYSNGYFHGKSSFIIPR